MECFFFWTSHEQCYSGATAEKDLRKKYIVGFLNGRKSHCGIIIFLRKKIPTIFFFLRKQKSHNIIFYFFFKVLRGLLGLVEISVEKKKCFWVGFRSAVVDRVMSIVELVFLNTPPNKLCWFLFSTKTIPVMGPNQTPAALKDYTSTGAVQSIICPLKVLATIQP